MTYAVKSPRKLIEVALPLDAINVASAREKSIRHGHPSTLHLWWARRPLATARAVIFAQLVNDPSWKWELENPGQIPPSHLKASWAASRKRLFKIIEDLVLWENTTNEVVLERARAEIRRSWREVCELNKEHPQANELFNPDKLPTLHDPFAGGGAIPLEAQRLGLEASASDLNPVAVLINKAMIEIPPKFAGRPPINPVARGERSLIAREWNGAQGLAEDIRYYGQWMREEAYKRIGHLYPLIEITAEMAHERPDLKLLVGKKLKVIAWLWARTVKSPSPAFSHVDVPLASTFVLSSKEGKQFYIQPIIKDGCYRFTVKKGSPPLEAQTGTKLARGANFRCLMSHTAIEGDYIKAEGRAGRMGSKMMAIVAEGIGSRVYLQPTPQMEAIAANAEPAWKPELQLPGDPRAFWTPPYGITHFYHLFTPRQLVALTTLNDLVTEARDKIRHDALAAGLSDNNHGLEADGRGATAYAEAVSVYLALSASKAADNNSMVCSWMPGIKYEVVRNTFSRQALPMTWDYAESNPFAQSSGDFFEQVKRVINFIEISLTLNLTPGSVVRQVDAQSLDLTTRAVISTDPPYYDNIGYADLSDFFYVWLRTSLKPVFPGIFATVAVPKAEELVATPHRHGSKEKAEGFFLDGMTKAMSNLTAQAHPAVPITIYYAFKQSETENVHGTSSTGWETFLEAVLRSGLQISGTWPMRTERGARAIGIGTNSLASSIILVCRKRPANASMVSRREFQRELNAVLPESLDEMTKGSGDDRSPVAPVDLSQAIIGPGMAVFSKYAAVLEADGTSMSVQTALLLINRFLAEDDFDPDTQFCLHWFEQHDWRDGRYGDAETLSRAKGTSVDGVRDAGVIVSGGGIVRLRKWAEYPTDWDPQADTRNPIWETLHHLIRALRQDGEAAAGRLLAATSGKAEATRQLAYRLYTLCERQGWAEDARAYNEIITGWSGVEAAANTVPTETQGKLFI